VRALAAGRITSVAEMVTIKNIAIVAVFVLRNLSCFIEFLDNLNALLYVSYSFMFYPKCSDEGCYEGWFIYNFPKKRLLSQSNPINMFPVA
jgi:hypothetical protein